MSGVLGDGVVPFRVEGVGVDVEGCHLGVGDLDALGVGGGVEFAADASGRSWWSCAAISSTMAMRLTSGVAAPGLGDVAEHAVLDLVPLRGAGRIVADLESQPGRIGQRLQFELPQPQARARWSRRSRR